MNAQKKQIVKKLVRFQNAVDAARFEADEAYGMSRGFDAGEFSGPAIGRAFERACDDLARRYGFSNADVAYDAVRRLRCYAPLAASF